MRVVPSAHDQPDNALRAKRLGVAKVVYPRRYSARRVAEQLRALLEEPEYRDRAGEVEDGSIRGRGSLRLRGHRGIAGPSEVIS